MAIVPLIDPLITAFIFIGLAIKPRVAPTICIVFIKKRLLNMASFIVLSILTITMIQSIIAITKNIKPICFALVSKLLTKTGG